MFSYQAEEKLLSKNLDKEYAPIHGLPEFTGAAAKLAFGEDSDIIKNGLVSIVCPKKPRSGKCSFQKIITVWNFFLI